MAIDPKFNKAIAAIKSYNAPNATSTVTKQPVYIAPGGSAPNSSSAPTASYAPIGVLAPTTISTKSSSPSLPGFYGVPYTPTSGGSSSGPINSSQLASGAQAINIPQNLYSSGGSTSIGGVGGSTGIGGGAGITGLSPQNYLTTALGSTTNMTRDANGNFVYNTNPELLKGNEQPTDPYAEMKALIGDQPKPDSLFTNPEYVQARQEKEAAQHRANVLNGQITTIVNNAQAQALSLEGQGRGIPEAIIGGQKAQIFKEAAIQALPLQAQLAVAQGDLQTATEHLQTVSQYVQENISNDFKYRTAVYDSAMGIFGKAIDAKLDAGKVKVAQDFTTQRDNSSKVFDLADTALKNGQGALATSLMRLASNPSDPDMMTKATALAGQITTDTNELSQLKKAVGSDGFTDPNLYARLRASSPCTLR